MSNKEIKDQVKKQLKAYRDAGRQLSVGLNASLEKLQAELRRLEGSTEVKEKKEYPPLDPPNFGEPEIILNPDPLTVQELQQDELEVGFDIETSRVRPHLGSIRLYQLYFPSSDTVCIWDTREPECYLNPLLTMLDSVVITKIIHNALFEYSWIREKHGIRLRNVLDTMILSQISRAGMYEMYQSAGLTNPNSLETLCNEFGFSYSKEHQSYDYDDDSPIPWAVYQYGAFDAKATYKLSKEIKRPKQDIDLKMTEVFGELSFNGFSANFEAIKELRQEYKDVWSKLYSEIENEWGVNPQSPQQLLVKIHQTYGTVPYTFDKKTKTRRPSTDKPSVNDFIASNPQLDTEILKKIQYFRSIKKVGEDYPKEYLVNHRNGKLHGDYRILGFQGEGRSSCKNPNIQNVAKHTSVHKMFGLPGLRSIFQAKEGRVFIEIDLAAAHAQIARFLSGDRKLILSRKTGIKLHFFTLQTMLKQQGIFLEPVEIKRAKADKDHEYYKLVNDLYKLSKNVFYSFLNFSGKNTLQSTFAKEDVIISTNTCDQYLKATASTFSDLREYQTKLVETVKSRYTLYTARDKTPLGLVGYLDIPDGSRIYYPLKYATPSKICASVWLRTEATAIKKALLEMQVQKINQAKKGDAWDTVYITNFSHDSFVLDCPIETAEKVADQAYEILTRSITEYVEDYEEEKEFLIDKETGLTRQPHKGEVFDKSDLKGYTISKVWS
jgi:DNA polymerase I-like protein with 3'-5' exonuclease and polymerase domains